MVVSGAPLGDSPELCGPGEIQAEQYVGLGVPIWEVGGRTGGGGDALGASEATGAGNTCKVGGGEEGPSWTGAFPLAEGGLRLGWVPGLGQPRARSQARQSRRENVNTGPGAAGCRAGGALGRAEGVSPGGGSRARLGPRGVRRRVCPGQEAPALFPGRRPPPPGSVLARGRTAGPGPRGPAWSRPLRPDARGSGEGNPDTGPGVQPQVGLHTREPRSCWSSPQMCFHAGVPHADVPRSFLRLSTILRRCFSYKVVSFTSQVRPGRGPAPFLAPPSHLGSGAQAGSALPSQVPSRRYPGREMR
nr:protein crumbs homolog 3 isoform X1 [Microcebus murinus]